MARYTKKSTTRPKRRYLRKKPKVSTAIKTYIKKSISKSNYKYVQEASAVESSATTLSLWYLDDYMQYKFGGLNQGQDKVMSQGFSFKYHLHNNSTTVPVVVRCLIIVNKRGQSNFGSYRSGSQIFEFTNIGAQNETNFSISGTTRDLIYRIDTEHYTVLRDFNIYLGTSAVDAKNMAQGNIYIPWKKMVKFDTNDGFNFPIKDNVAMLFIPIEGPNDVSLGSTVEVTARGSWFFQAS